MRRSSDWDNIGLSCRLNRLNKHSRWDKWQDKVSFCSLIHFNWRVPARVPLFLLGLKAHRSGPCGHSGRLSEVVLTHYRRREVRNSIYRYREIHIDYRSKFSYRFMSFISIIYGNTTQKFLTMSTCKKNNYPYGSGHEGGAVLLPGFAITWQQNQVTRQSHIRDLIHGYACSTQVNWIDLHCKMFHPLGQCFINFWPK